MDDWKLKARAVVKLHKERNMFVSSCLVYLFRTSIENLVAVLNKWSTYNGS